jgi:hypothetical protein
VYTNELFHDLKKVNKQYRAKVFRVFRYVYIVTNRAIEEERCPATTSTKKLQVEGSQWTRCLRKASLGVPGF